MDVDLDVLPLFNIGPKDCDREELPLVLVGVLKENLEIVLVVEILLVVLRLVLVGRNTPDVARNDVVELANKVLFKRQDAGIVKQHGRPAYALVLGWRAPV